MSADTTDLESSVTTPTGGLAPRCQATSKHTGTQCAKPARKGYRVCSTHGAGTAAREESGERKPVGRPPLNGLYSKRESFTLTQLIEEVYQTQDAFENSDRDLAALKATSWSLKERIENFLPQLDTLDHALEIVQGVVQDNESCAGAMSLDDALTISRSVRDAARLLSTFDSLMRALADVQMKTINAHKIRAETQAKLAETQAVETFGRMYLALRPILSETLADPALYNALDARVRREVLGPVKLELN